MNQKNFETCPKCGEKAIMLKETKTFDGSVKQYKCLNCNYSFSM